MKIKSGILNYPLIIMGLVLMLAGSCKEKDETSSPSLLTSAIKDITKTTATGGGLITSDGVESITERGVCWSTQETPTIADSKVTSIINAVNYKCAITGLKAGTTYYVRAYATNSGGTGYSATALTFKTLAPGTPELTTTDISQITETGATGGGNITSDGGAEITARGICWSDSPNPTINDNKTTDGTEAGSFTSAITGLKGGTIYYVRAYATNGAGTGYGDAKTFSTLAVLGAPVLTTIAASNVTDSTAICGGNITNVGASAVTASGICWSTGSTPTTADNKTTDGTTTGSFSSTVTGLRGLTKYYVRAYATNATGTGYGDAVSFTTLVGPPTDYEGNVYHMVTIGTQVWLTQDLKTTHYNDGEAIPNVTGDAEWAALKTPAYCWNSNDQAAFPKAAFYNWYAVNSGKLCPKGWHVPSTAEFIKLTEGLGGQAVAGTALKAITGWKAPNAGATNSTGFSAMSNGYRYETSRFAEPGEYSSWYTSTEYTDPSKAYQWWASFDGTNFSESNVYKTFGSPVRCIKD